MTLADDILAIQNGMNNSLVKTLITEIHHDKCKVPTFRNEDAERKYNTYREVAEKLS